MIRSDKPTPNVLLLTKKMSGAALVTSLLRRGVRLATRSVGAKADEGAIVTVYRDREGMRSAILLVGRLVKAAAADRLTILEDSE